MSDIFKYVDKDNSTAELITDKNQIKQCYITDDFPKIPKFEKGGICNDTICTKLDVFSQIDEIVKDIRDRQDNAMAMEFTKCIGELLKNNGVVPKIKQFGRDFYGENSFQSKSGVIIDELDFSEHDKVFEDKINKLQDENNKLHNQLIRNELYSMEAKDLFENDGVEGLISQYRNIGWKLDVMSAENRELQKNVKDYEDKIAEQKNEISILKSLIDNYSDAESKLFDEKRELKQRIAELESKETEKPTKINLNDRVKVKLTPLGAEIYYHQHDDIHKDYPKMKKHLQSSLPKVDENGYTEFQLWHFIELYGEHIGMCKKNVIDPLDIIISE